MEEKNIKLIVIWKFQKKLGLKKKTVVLVIN